MHYPKIGIRPTIDGRWGGVRESQEAQTMGTAYAAAELISATLSHPDSTHVQQRYHPHAWVDFGTDGLESADYRGCATFGPLYS